MIRGSFACIYTQHFVSPFFCLPQQNEIVRENQFYNWTIGKHNLFPLLFMTVLFPVWFHGMYKGELETRDIKMNKHEKPLERL